MTGNTPLVSVIMIFLNAERFMEEAIASILGQSYRRWELLLVDDGSTDDSTHLARHYAEHYPDRVRYLAHPGHANRGMSASRNLGIRKASGHYIAFLDADDLYLPEKLERQVAALRQQPRAAMVYGPTLHWYSWTGRPEDQLRDIPRKLGVPGNTLVEPPALIPLFLQLKAQTPGTCGLMVRREAVEEVGGFDAFFPGMFEDQVFCYKICLTMPVFVMSRSWDRYRQHAQSWSRVRKRSGAYHPHRPNASYHRFLLWLQAYVDKKQVKEVEIQRQLHRALWPYRHPFLYRLLPSWVRRIR